MRYREDEYSGYEWNPEQKRSRGGKGVVETPEQDMRDEDPEAERARNVERAASDINTDANGGSSADPETIDEDINTHGSER
jgi:hypothetical protein